MKNSNSIVKRWLAAAFAFMALGGLCLTTQAQSNDALLDVLIKKGVLTKEEAASVRKEAADAKPAETTSNLRSLEAYAETEAGKSALDAMLDDKRKIRMSDACVTQRISTDTTNLQTHRR